MNIYAYRKLINYKNKRLEYLLSALESYLVSWLVTFLETCLTFYPCIVLPINFYKSRIFLITVSASLDFRFQNISDFKDFK